MTARSRTAYHEAGHAVLSSAINDAPFQVSIRKIGESLGRAGYRMLNRPEVLVQVHLAGFAAEHVLTGKRSRDFEKRLPFAILSASEPGLASLAEGQEGTDEHRAVRELLVMGCNRTTVALRAEADRFYDIAKESLSVVWPAVDALARALLKHEELDGDDVSKVVYGHDVFTKVFAVQRAQGIITVPGGPLLVGGQRTLFHSVWGHLSLAPQRPNAPTLLAAGLPPWRDGRTVRTDDVSDNDGPRSPREDPPYDLEEAAERQR